MIRVAEETKSKTSERAKARWAILRSAILKQSPSSNSTVSNEDKGVSATSQYSIHRFQGFQVLQRRIIPLSNAEWKRITSIASNYDEYYMNSLKSNDGFDENINNPNSTETTSLSDEATDCPGYECVEYELPLINTEINLQPLTTSMINNSNSTIIKSNENSSIIVRTREKITTTNSHPKINLQELMSHVHHGVDNTGNTRVWDSCLVLARVIICGSDVKDSKSDSDDNVAHPSFASTMNQMSCSEDNTAMKYPILSSFNPDFAAKMVNICNKNSLSKSSSNCASAIRSPSSFLGLDHIFSLATRVDTLNDEMAQDEQSSGKVLRILELGAGMAGITSLMLASLGCRMSTTTNMQSTNTTTTTPQIHVTITDGHPNAVENNKSCVALTTSIHHLQSQPTIQCYPLLWKDTEEGAKECKDLLRNCHLINNNTENSSETLEPIVGFDLVLVSDCTHFTNFHTALIATIGRTLRVGGICVLCQPCRASTLCNFVELVSSLNEASKQGPLFEIQLYDHYDTSISKQHMNEMKNENGGSIYDPSIHYPLIVTLQKLREYEENMDTLILKEKR